MLVSDLEAAHAADGATASLAEILVCSTGVHAVLHHRIAHVLHHAGLPFLARLVAEIGYAETGVHIHPNATIGPRFFVDRGTGVVIGETATVGANVRIHQGVTLGTLDGASNDTRHHPRIEDDVVIHAGATLLGPITIGARSTIGGNVWLTESVRAGSVVTQAATRGD
jgi:serine O-acetyltransferase